MKASTLTFLVDWADCDPAGIVFYPQFFRMMNTGTHKLFEHAGLPYYELFRRYTAIGTPLIDVQATFRSPARFGDSITLESEVVEWRKRTFIVRHVMRAGERVVFEAREVRAWAVEDKSRPNGIKAVPVPAEVKAMFGA